MSKRSIPTPSRGHGWFARQWLKTLKKSQADVCRGLGWKKASASEIITGKQRYNQDAVEELADFLNIRPYELLLHPEDAMNLRQLRHTAAQIARLNAVRDAIPVESKAKDAPEAEEAKPQRKRAS